MVSESWLRRVWGRRREATPAPEKAMIGVLAYEVGGLMSKVVQLWYALSDDQIVRLRDETLRLAGVRKLVSDDDDYLLGLALSETLDALAETARSVVRLGRRCSDPVLQRLEVLFRSDRSAAAGEWDFGWKKMRRKVKKMERFATASSNLYQEMEVLVELEQGLRRMQASGADPSQGSFIEFQRKVLWQRQEVKYLRDNSVWNRSYDYVVRLLVRSLFTVLGRIKHVFGISPMSSLKGIDHLPRSQSVSGVGHSLVHPSENNSMKFTSGPLGRSGKPGYFSSGPLGRFSGSKSGPLGVQWRSKGTFRGCMTVGLVEAEPPPVLNSHSSADQGYTRSNGIVFGFSNGVKEEDFWGLLSSKKRLQLNAPPSTLGAAALALHYANIVIVIEKMVTCPHLIAADARDDLYNMLPTSVRAALRVRLKGCGRNLGSFVYDADLVGEWSEALGRILEWLAPLAHNMVRWQSERSFEQQHLASRTNVLLLQTLYFANQAKTEAVITELLVGLNYLCRVHAEPNSKAFLEARGSVDFNEYLATKG